MITDSDNNIENRAVPMTVRVPARLHERLKRMADHEHEHAATIIRRALRRELGDQIIETR